MENIESLFEQMGICLSLNDTTINLKNLNNLFHKEHIDEYKKVWLDYRERKEMEKVFLEYLFGGELTMSVVDQRVFAKYFELEKRLMGVHPYFFKYASFHYNIYNDTFDLAFDVDFFLNELFEKETASIKSFMKTVYPEYMIKNVFEPQEALNNYWNRIQKKFGEINDVIKEINLECVFTTQVFPLLREY